MNRYKFVYSDGTGVSVSQTYRFSDDEDALAAAQMTFERFSVEVFVHGRSVGKFPPCMAIGLKPRDDVVMT